MRAPTDTSARAPAPALLGFEELDRHATAYDRAVDAARLIDPFCSGSPWLLSAREAFGEQGEPFVVQLRSGWAPLMRIPTTLGRTLVPLESSWGLAAPVVAEDRREAAAELGAFLAGRRSEWDALFLSGLERGAPDFTALVHKFSRGYRLGLGQATVRCVARLDGGLDGFLSRRTAKFRKNLRNDGNRASGVIGFEVIAPTERDDALAAYERILDIEAKSWKGMSGHGIQEGAMRTFYAGMVPRLADRGELRVTLARDLGSGEPIGYVLGGLRGDSYRGLQISFDQVYSKYGLGNLLQLHTIAALCAEGVRCYDLGTDMEYKRHWAELLPATVPLVVR